MVSLYGLEDLGFKGLNPRSVNDRIQGIRNTHVQMKKRHSGSSSVLCLLRNLPHISLYA